jgi:hypothetical protein
MSPVPPLQQGLGGGQAGPPACRTEEVVDEDGSESDRIARKPEVAFIARHQP